MTSDTVDHDTTATLVAVARLLTRATGRAGCRPKPGPRPPLRLLGLGADDVA